MGVPIVIYARKPDFSDFLKYASVNTYPIHIKSIEKKEPETGTGSNKTTRWFLFYGNSICARTRKVNP